MGLLLSSDSARAAREIFAANGEPTADGRDALAALDAVTAQRIDAFRQEKLRSARQATWGCGLLQAVPSIIFLPVASESPGVYWTFFALSLICIGALITSIWRDTQRRIRNNTAAATRSRLRTIETWQQISAMTEDEYAKLLRRSQNLDTAGRMARRFAKPAARVGKLAVGIVVSGDLSSALDILDDVGGNN